MLHYYWIVDSIHPGGDRRVSTRVSGDFSGAEYSGGRTLGERVKYITRADVPVLPSVSARKSTGENTRNEEHGDINIYTIYNV